MSRVAPTILRGGLYYPVRLIRKIVGVAQQREDLKNPGVAGQLFTLDGATICRVSGVDHDCRFVLRPRFVAARNRF